MSEENPTVFGGRYELHRRLARGGMADVFLARDQLLGRPVAVKVLFPEFATDPKFVERFRREAQAAANLNHPNIVSIYDWGEELGTYYIVMEYVEGQSLAQILKRDKTLSIEQVTRVALDVSAALGFAHEGGVVHRDVKPGNVLVSPKGEMKVADFGIATAASANTDDNLTQTGSVMGTATYFSPEQAQGRQVDHRSDLYSLGVVMYEMLVGEPPFTGETPVSIAYKHVQEPVVPISERGADIPPALAAIIMKLLAKNPDNRYRSADALLGDLDRFRQGQAIAAAAALGTPASGAPPVVPALGATTALPAQPSGTQVLPATYQVPPRRSAGLIIVGLLTAALILAGFLILLQRNLTADSGDNDAPALVDAVDIEIPPVGGRGEADARGTLEAQGFIVQRRDLADNAVPLGQVIATEPPVGTTVSVGSTVTIVVSTGASLNVVPAVITLSENEALQQISAAGFQPQTQRVTSRIAPEGEVVAQDPVAQALAAPGSVVTIQVSAGTEEIPVPDVRGQQLDDARAFLESEGFIVSDQLDQAFDEEIERDLVVGTVPEVGEELAPGSTVIIVISDGAEDLLMPSYIGVAKAEAFEAMRELGLNPIEFGQFVTNPDMVGRVVDTLPGPNSPVSPGAQVQVMTGLLDPNALGSNNLRPPAPVPDDDAGGDGDGGTGGQGDGFSDGN